MITFSIKVHDEIVSKKDIEDMTYEQAHFLSGVVSEKEWKAVCKWWNNSHPHSYKILQ